MVKLRKLLEENEGKRFALVWREGGDLDIVKGKIKGCVDLQSDGRDFYLKSSEFGGAGIGHLTSEYMRKFYELDVCLNRRDSDPSLLVWDVDSYKGHQIDGKVFVGEGAMREGEAYFARK
ncbi:hypothetical protein HNV12_01260 [Methanococcoides sp. SA1]|nr:hypothetical protein [Methanococcoides sp. SA1]